MALSGKVKLLEGENKQPVIVLGFMNQPGYVPKPFTTVEECASEYVRMYVECGQSNSDNFLLMIAQDTVMSAVHQRLTIEVNMYADDIKERVEALQNGAAITKDVTTLMIPDYIMRLFDITSTKGLPSIKERESINFFENLFFV